MEEMNRFCESQTKLVLSKLGEDSYLRREVMKRISNYDYFFKRDLLKLLDDDIDVSAIRYNMEILSVRVQELLKKEGATCMKTLDKRLFQLTSVLHSLEFPHEDLSWVYSEYFKDTIFHPSDGCIVSSELLEFELASSWITIKGSEMAITPGEEGSFGHLKIYPDILKDVYRVLINTNGRKVSDRDYSIFSDIWRSMREYLSFGISIRGGDSLDKIITSLNTIKYKIRELDIKIDSWYISSDYRCTSIFALSHLLRELIPTMSNLQSLHLEFHCGSNEIIISFAQKNKEII